MKYLLMLATSTLVVGILTGDPTGAIPVQELEFAPLYIYVP